MTIVYEEKPAGSYDVEFCEKNLSSGINLYTVPDGNYIW